MKKFGSFLAIFILSAVAVFAQSGGVKGKVRSTKGDGIAGVEITARQNGKDVKSVKSDNKGSFAMSGLSAGVYSFVFERSGFSSGLKNNVEIQSGKTTDLGGNLVLGTDQGTIVFIKGSVFNQDGRSVTGAKVELERINSDGSTKKLDSVYTNVSGEFNFRQPEGAATYRLTANLKDARASKEVIVESAAIYRLALMLELPRKDN